MHINSILSFADFLGICTTFNWRFVTLSSYLVPPLFPPCYLEILLNTATEALISLWLPFRVRTRLQHWTVWRTGWCVSGCSAALPPDRGVSFLLDSWPVTAVWQPEETDCQASIHAYIHISTQRSWKSETLWLIYTHKHMGTVKWAARPFLSQTVV